MSNDIQDKDKKDWQDFILSKEKLPNKDQKYQKKSSFKIRSIDLHGYSLDQANKTIDDFIQKSYLEKIDKLIIVTGKGLHSKNEKDPFVSKDLSILKYSVPEYIEKNKNLKQLIIETKNAKIEDGGSGAFYVYLKNKNKFK